VAEARRRCWSSDTALAMSHIILILYESVVILIIKMADKSKGLFIVS